MRIGLIGCGSIGTVLARHADSGSHLSLDYVFDIDPSKSEALADSLKKKPEIAQGVGDMLGCDLVIEAASQNAVRQYATRVLERCDLMIMSVGALSDSSLAEGIEAAAESHGHRVFLPSGALVGLDGIRAAAASGIEKVTLTTRKHPNAFVGAPYVKEKDINLNAIRKPEVIFDGKASEAAKGFPNNINVSVVLAIAGIGLDKTKVRIVADPLISVNVHEVVVEGPFGRMSMTTMNKPFPDNPKTSYLAALSAIATMEKTRENITIGP